MTKFSLWNWTEHLIQKSFTLTLILRCKQNIQFGMFSAWGKLQKSATTEKWKKKWISQYTIHTKVTWFKISQRRRYFFFSFKIMLECISFGQSGVLTNCQLPIYMSKTPPNNFFVQRSSALYGPEPAFFFLQKRISCMNEKLMIFIIVINYTSTHLSHMTELK